MTQSAAIDRTLFKAMWLLPIAISVVVLSVFVATNELVLAIVLAGLGVIVLSASIRMRLYILVALLPFAHAGIGLPEFTGFGVYDIFVLWCILLFLWRVAVVQLFQIELPKSLQLAFIVMAFFVPSVVHSVDLFETFRAFVQFAVSILTAAVVYDGLKRVDNRAFQHRLLTVLFFTAAIVSLIALYQTMERGGLVVVATGRAAFSLFPDPNYFSGYLLMALAIGVGLALNEKRLLPRLLLLGSLLAVVVAIVAGVSRSALVVLILLVLAYAVYFFFQPGARKLLSVVVMAGFVGLIGVLLLTDVGSKVVDLFTLTRRIETVVAGQDASVQQRQNITVITLDMIKANLVTGVGFGAFEKTFGLYRGGYLSTMTTGSAHNTFLRILGETGLVGFLPFMVFVVFVMRGLWRSYQSNRDENERVLLIAILFSISTFWLMSLTLDQLFEPHFWVVYGIGLYMLWCQSQSTLAGDEKQTKNE